MSTHLDAKRLRALLTGQLTEGDERALVEHLVAGECEACEEFLGRLDVDQAGELVAVLDRATQARDLPLEARERVIDKTAGRRFGPLPALLPVAGLAMLLIIGVVVTLVHVLGTGDEDGQRVKGDGRSAVVAVELSLGLAEGDAVRRVKEGATLPAEGALVFRVSTDMACYLYLARLGTGDVEMLWPVPGGTPHRHTGGSFTPMSGGRPAGMALTELSGEQIFAAVCAPEPLQVPAEIEVLAETLRAGSRPAVVSYDVVHVRVAGKEATP